LGIENTSHVETHPLRGSLFENMVTLELLKKRYNAGLDNNLYFYRDNHGNEVDIMQEAGYQLNLFEIKSAETFTPHFLKGLDYFKKIVPDRVGISNLVYAGSDEMSIKEHRIVNYKNLFR